jgi:eukaryotic-like serine/threonine-protein kinase
MSDSEHPVSIGPFVVHRKLGEGAMGVVFAGYDVSLDRKVALKLVRKQLLNKPAVRARMIREAQAMARLSSPHVVQVYQVGEHRDGIYLAMEYIDGASLGEWLKAEKRSWQLVLRTLCDAGRGLAAAHAAGLVHRDFKPDNVLVDGGGRARVLDFGLVQSDGGGPVGETDEMTQSTAGLDETMHSSGVVGEGVERSNIHWSVRLTQFGRTVGTPAYMSPEQHFGAAVGPFSDQYSFAITLYEALYGVRPFNGDSWDSLKAQVRQGHVPAPPGDSRVPRWIYKILARALALEPSVRWPTMGAMVDALERDPQRARIRVVGVVGLLGVASAVSYAVALSRAPAQQDQCTEAVQELAGVWDEARRVEVARAFAATKVSFAADVLRHVELRLGTYTDAWVAEHTAACEASVAGRQTSNLLDLRMACLGRQRASLAALLDIFVTADGAVVENAVQAVAALPSVHACTDAETLLAVAPPDDARTVVQVDQLRKQLARVRALEGTGRYEPGLELAAKVRAEAKLLGYAPLEAEAALAEGSLLMASLRPEEAESALVRALGLAITGDLHEVAAEAAARRVFVLGDGLRKHSDALTTQPVAEALVLRARDDGRLAALLYNNIGVVQMTLHDYETARASYERTIALLQARAGAPDPLLAATHHNLGNMYQSQGRLEAAGEQYRVARELFTKILGGNHPLGAHPLASLGDIALQTGAYEEAARSYEEALALEEAAYGTEHLYLMQPLVGLGRVHARTGEPARARASFRRVVAIADRHGAIHEYLAQGLEGLGELDMASEPAEARRLFERAVEVYASALGKDSGEQATAALRAGELAAQAGDKEAAMRWFERVLALPADGKVEVRAAAAVGLAKQRATRPEATRG